MNLALHADGGAIGLGDRWIVVVGAVATDGAWCRHVCSSRFDFEGKRLESVGAPVGVLAGSGLLAAVWEEHTLLSRRVNGYTAQMIRAFVSA